MLQLNVRDPIVLYDRRKHRAKLQDMFISTTKNLNLTQRNDSLACICRLECELYVALLDRGDLFIA